MKPEILFAPYPRVDDLEFEVVERKGIGHPDTLCDAIAERASAYYSQYSLEHFRAVAHHWFDKVMLVGGNSELGFGFGKFLSPLKVIFAGKAAFHVGGKSIPVEEILTRAAVNVLTETLYKLDQKDIRIQLELTHSVGPGQPRGRYNPQTNEDLFVLEKNVALSNDCNVCTGFAPFSQIEKLVLDTEMFLRSRSFREGIEDTGFDIKVVGTRRNKAAKITVNLPFIAEKISSREIYLKRVHEIEDILHNRYAEKTEMDLTFEINPEKSSGRSYLTVTGTVADTGDVGAVGRGNRLNGLITPMRPMSVEAVCGKNPCDHTGKLYGILAQDIAKDIFENLNLPVDVHLVTFKGKLVSEPTDAVIYVHENLDSQMKQQVQEIYENRFKKIVELRTELIQGLRTLW